MCFTSPNEATIKWEATIKQEGTFKSVANIEVSNEKTGQTRLPRPRGSLQKL